MQRTIDERTAAAEERWKKAWAEGPTRLRWATVPPQIGDPAPDATLVDHDDNAVLLSSLWEHQPLLLLFWRHFGCSCSVDRAARLREELGGLRARMTYISGSRSKVSESDYVEARPASWRYRRSTFIDGSSRSPFASPSLRTDPKGTFRTALK